MSDSLLHAIKSEIESEGLDAIITEHDKPMSTAALLLAKRYFNLTDKQRQDFELAANNPELLKIKCAELSTWKKAAELLGPIEWEWTSWLPKGMLTILAGESGAGKSALALRLAGCFIEGWNWPDGQLFKDNPGAVLWVECEAAQALNLERAKKWGLPLDKLITPLNDPLADVDLSKPDNIAMLAVAALRDDIRLIIIDSLRGMHRGDENSSDSMTIIKWLAELARDTNKPIMLTHHLRKRGMFDNEGVEIERLRGSSAIVQTARLVWALDTPDINQKERKRLQVIKSNLAKFPDPVGMDIDDQGVNFGEAPEPPRIETTAEKAADLLLALLSDQPMRASELQNEVEGAGISWISAKRAKAKLGIHSIKKDDGWYWGLPYKENVN